VWQFCRPFLPPRQTAPGVGIYRRQNAPSPDHDPGFDLGEGPPARAGREALVVFQGRGDAGMSVIACGC